MKITLQNKKIFALLAVPLLAASAVQAQDEETIYSERFINLSGGNLNFSEFGYTTVAYFPAIEENVLDVSELDAEGQSGVRTTGIGGRGAEICFCNDDTGGMFFWTFGSEAWYLTSIDFPIDRSQKEISRATWMMSWGGTVFPMEARFYVRIGGVNYVSTSVYDELDTAEKNEFRLIEYSFETSMGWQVLSAEPGQPWNLDGAVVDLPSGNIEAMGFYVYKGAADDHGSLRLDEVKVYATAASGGSDTWGGYDITVDGNLSWVDTGNWTGWLEVTDSPWVYSNSLDNWLFVDEADVASGSGAWLYILAK